MKCRNQRYEFDKWKMQQNYVFSTKKLLLVRQLQDTRHFRFLWPGFNIRIRHSDTNWQAQVTQQCWLQLSNQCYQHKDQVSSSEFVFSIQAIGVISTACRVCRITRATDFNNNLWSYGRFPFFMILRGIATRQICMQIRDYEFSAVEITHWLLCTQTRTLKHKHNARTCLLLWLR